MSSETGTRPRVLRAIAITSAAFSGTPLFGMAVRGMAVLGIAGRGHSRIAFTMPMASYISYLHSGVFRSYASGGHTYGDPKE